MNYRPLSTRGRTDSRFDGFQDGLPPWIRSDVEGWFARFLSVEDLIEGEHPIEVLYKRMRLDRDRYSSTESRRRPLEHVFEIYGDHQFAFDLLDYALRYLPEWGSPADAEQLEVILSRGTSAWQVSRLDLEGRYALTRREAGPLTEALEDLVPVAGRAGAHLLEAWKHLAGRDPLPDQAYSQAVLAIESAAKPVISPKDEQATLGKMIKAVKDAPRKFTFILGEPEAILTPMEAMWKTHRRHGTDDESVPTGMSREEADAAFHLALTTVRWFSSGAFARVP